MLCLLDCLGTFMRRFNPQNSRGLLYGMYYGLSYPLAQVSTYLIAIIIMQYPWKYSFSIPLPGLCVSWLIVRFFMHGQRAMRKFPLYQVDWIGYGLFVVTGLSFAYACVYGERLRWLENIQIRTAFYVTICAFAVWIIRMLTVKRPYVNIKVIIKYKQIPWGIGMMLVLYAVYNTFNISTEFMKGALQYDDSFIACTNLYMAILFVVCIPLTGIWLHHHHRVREPLVLAFILFALYYWGTARIFYEEENRYFFLFPMIIRAAAHGICITSLGYFTSVNIPIKDNSARAFFSLAPRNIMGSLISSAFWMNRFDYIKQYHYTSIASQYIPEDSRVQTLWQTAASSLFNSGDIDGITSSVPAKLIQENIYKQSVILGARDLHYILGLICLLIAIIVFFLKIFDIHYKNAMNQYSLAKFKD